MSYAAPLEEMRFVLDRLAGLPEIAALPGFEDAQPDVVEAILTEAARFASEVLAPLNATGDRQGCRWEGGRVTTPDGFPLAYRQFVDAGWHAMPVSSAIGGQGMPALLSSAVAEMWKSANLAFSLCQMLTIGAVEALAHHASDELKARFLPKMVAGEWTGTMNLTESQAGSDLSTVRTRAEPDGENYRLFGSKIFITWGEHDVAENIIHLVLARLPDAPVGTRGISLFVAPKFLVAPDGSLGVRNDLSCVSIEHKLGIHASPTAIISYGDKEGAIAYLVGERAHRLGVRLHVHEHAPHIRMMDDRCPLAAADRPALQAGACVGDGLLVGRLRDGHALKAHIQPGVVHHGEHVFQAAVRLADEVGDRALLIAIGHDGSGGGVYAQLVFD